MEKGKTLDPWGFPCGSAGKESACNAGDLGSIPELGRSSGEGNGYLLWCSGLEIPWIEEPGLQSMECSRPEYWSA